MTIINRDKIRAKGAAAFRAGISRNSHGMNFDANALADWLAGYDEAAASLASKVIAHSIPFVQRTAAGGVRVEQEQVKSC